MTMAVRLIVSSENGYLLREQMAERTRHTAQATQRHPRFVASGPFEGTFLPVLVSRGLWASRQIEVRSQGCSAPAGHCSIEVSPLHLVACARERLQSQGVVIAVM